MSTKYPLATSSWDQAEYDALNRVIDSDMFSMGPEVRAFEEQFATQFGSKYAVMVMQLQGSRARGKATEVNEPVNPLVENVVKRALNNVEE